MLRTRSMLLASSLLLCAGAYGYFVIWCSDPDAAVIAGEEMSARDLELLRGEGMLAEGERVLYFYSDGPLSVCEQGSFYTDSRVVSYGDCEGKFEVQQATYSEIKAITPEYQDDLLVNSEVLIERRDGTSFRLLVSNQENLDEAFVELLQATWESAR